MKDAGIVDSIVELKYLVSKLSQFSIVEPNKQDISILRIVLEIVKGMEVPEILGVVDAKTEKEYN